MTVAVERRGPVGWMRYGGEHGLLSAVGLRELRRSFLALDADPSIRVIVLSGDPVEQRFVAAMHPADARAMSALTIPALLHGIVGRSLPLLRLLARPRLLDLLDPIRAGFLEHLLLFGAIERSSKITVAAIGGDCFGGGLELALCFDLRVAIDRDICLAQPESVLGLVPGFGATWRMARLVGSARALELQLTGRPLGPQEAERIGLVSQVLPAPTFVAEVLALAERLARRSPEVAVGIKRAVGAQDRGQAELTAVLGAWVTPEARQGLDRFELLIAEERAAPRSTRELLAVVDGG